MTARRAPRWAPCGLAILLAGTLVFADQAIKLSMGEYRQRKFDSVSPEAYARARVRAAKTQVGMRSDAFFETMEMLIVRDKKGEPVDGFVEGYLQQESTVESEARRPDSVIIFGWYQDWKHRKKPVPKFRMLFRDSLLAEITFADPAEDWRTPGEGAKP